MTIGAWRRQALERLHQAGDPDARADADWLLCGVLHVERGYLRCCSDRSLTTAEIEALETRLQRRTAREPLQYIESRADFMGIPLYVDPRVLIPRADTETLAEIAIGWAAGKSVLDLCTGSGALAIAIARRCPGARVTATDISPDALAVARRNADQLGVTITWRQGDLFAPLVGQRFDVIVCNPPYLTAADMEERQIEVRHEPTLALYGGPDGLAYYRRIAEALPDHIEDGGCIGLEVGMGQADDVRALLATYLGPETTTGVTCDLCGVPRVVWARRFRQRN